MQTFFRYFVEVVPLTSLWIVNDKVLLPVEHTTQKHEAVVLLVVTAETVYQLNRLQVLLSKSRFGQIRCFAAFQTECRMQKRISDAECRMQDAVKMQILHPAASDAECRMQVSCQILHPAAS